MILGHAHPEVIEAIIKAAERGTSFGAPTEAESVLAEQIIEAVPSVEKVRLVNSGTEATMSAIRVARGATGRDKIIKFSGNYHGHVDSLLVAAGSAAATLGVPDSPGVTKGAGKDTIVLAYNDCEGVVDAFAQHPGEIAAVILEPVVGNMGCVPATMEFMNCLREATSKDGSILIFDEVMTGFRLAFGGAQQRFGMTPDMSTLGKVVGGGMPLGAYGGRADIMDQVLPAGKVFQAGTLSGNPVAVAAGSTTLRLLRDDPPYDYLEALGDRLADRPAQGCLRRRRRPSSPARREHDDAVLQCRPGSQLVGCRSLQSRTLRKILLGNDCRGSLHALQPVRGTFLQPHAYRIDDRRNDRGGRKGAAVAVVVCHSEE